MIYQSLTNQLHHSRSTAYRVALHGNPSPLTPPFRPCKWPNCNLCLEYIFNNYRTQTKSCLVLFLSLFNRNAKPVHILFIGLSHHTGQRRLGGSLWRLPASNKRHTHHGRNVSAGRWAATPCRILRLTQSNLSVSLFQLSSHCSHWW